MLVFLFGKWFLLGIESKVSPLVYVKQIILIFHYRWKVWYCVLTVKISMASEKPFGN